MQSVTDYAIYVLDLDGRIRTWNTGAQRIKGYPSEEILGKHFSCFYTPEDIAAGEPAKTLSVAARDGRFEAEAWRVRRDGSRFWASVIIDAMRSPDGAVIGFAKVTRDISEIREASHSLFNENRNLRFVNKATSRNEERFRQMVEGVPSAILIVNAAGRVLMTNGRTEALFGYPRAELIGGPMEMLLPIGAGAQHADLVRQFFADPIARQWGARHPLFAKKRDGTAFQVEVTLSPIDTDEGTMMLATVVDISDRVRLEEQVRQSQRMDAIGGVAAGVAHDFNNLLQALGGSLELMVEMMADRPDAIAMAQIALRAAAKGKDLTTRLLAFSGKQLLIARPVQIDALFAELHDLIAPMFGTNTKARTELIVNPAAPGLAVMADRAQLDAALINLAVNARDAMADGGCLRISSYASDADPELVPAGRYTVISVADTGCGMDAETLAQACEPFFSTKGLNGTGLGLPMVQGFARQSGGNVHITSVAGEGTTVDLWLPAISAPVDAAAPDKSDGSLGRVLVVDDSEDSLIVVSMFLRRAGYDVVSKHNGELALAELRGGRRFDAIVTDFAMPGINGVELLRLARKIEPSVPAMIITGFSDPDVLSALEDALVLRKPFNRGELTTAVDQLIADARVMRAN